MEMVEQKVETHRMTVQRRKNNQMVTMKTKESNLSMSTDVA